ncbi:MAG: transposase [Ignavibacteriales bacterium]|nr:transposase [Ignavibacteriales bacterium]
MRPKRYNNPRENADIERVIRTLKEDLVWPHDRDNPYQFKDALDKWIKEYNMDFPHSTLKWKTPDDFEKEFYEISNIISA